MNQEAWRTAAPYKACFNDLGMIYFGLIRVMYHAALHFSGISWGMDEWEETESAAAAAWWAQDLQAAVSKGIYDDDDVWFYLFWKLDNKNECGALWWNCSVELFAIQLELLIFISMERPWRLGIIRISTSGF